MVESRSPGYLQDTRRNTKDRLLNRADEPNISIATSERPQCGIVQEKHFDHSLSGVALLALPAEAQEHCFEDDPVVMMRENFVVRDVLSHCNEVRVSCSSANAIRCALEIGSASKRGPYVCIYPQDTISPSKWTRQKALSK